LSEKLPNGATLHTAWAERCDGPGWCNELIWYVWSDSTGEHHIDALQPDEQTTTMRTLFPLSAAASVEMTRAVHTHLTRKKDEP